jgi:hypothetical protein
MARSKRNQSSFRRVKIPILGLSVVIVARSFYAENAAGGDALGGNAPDST